VQALVQVWSSSVKFKCYFPLWTSREPMVKTQHLVLISSDARINDFFQLSWNNFSQLIFLHELLESLQSGIYSILHICTAMCTFIDLKLGPLLRPGILT
jgi:hypothetical protein